MLTPTTMSTSFVALSDAIQTALDGGLHKVAASVWVADQGADEENSFCVVFGPSVESVDRLANKLNQESARVVAIHYAFSGAHVDACQLNLLPT